MAEPAGGHCQPPQAHGGPLLHHAHPAGTNEGRARTCRRCLVWAARTRHHSVPSNVTCVLTCLFSFFLSFCVDLFDYLLHFFYFSVSSLCVGVGPFSVSFLTSLLSTCCSLPSDKTDNSADHLSTWTIHMSEMMLLHTCVEQFIDK